MSGPAPLIAHIDIVAPLGNHSGALHVKGDPPTPLEEGSCAVPTIHTHAPSPINLPPSTGMCCPHHIWIPNICLNWYVMLG